MRSLRRGILCFGRRVAETSTTACAGDITSAISESSLGGTPEGSGASIFNKRVEGGSRLIRGSILLGVIGVILSMIGYLIAVLDPYTMIIKYSLSMTEGSFAFNLWRKPPVPVFLRVYVFNVTNSEAFLRGEERLRVQEVGPYVYREELENTNINFGIGDDDSVSFEPKRTMHWEADMSRGTLQDKIIVPNIPLLGLASLMSKSSAWVQLAFSSLTNYLASKPFLQISVEEYLWAHEEPLLSLASKILPSWVPFTSLGLLDRLMDMGTHNITINDGRNDPSNIHRIQKVNGADVLGTWSWDRDPEPEQEDLYKACKMRDTVSGAFDGLLYPQDIQTDSPLRMYRDAFCRSLVLMYKRDVTVGQFSARRFQPLYGAFNSTEPENACVCVHNVENCLPSGLSEVTPCFYSIPTAASFPHLYQADSRLREEVLGLTPDKDKHETYLDIQPDVGVPLEAHSRVQLNLLMKDTSRIRRAAPFSGLVIPIAWTDLSLDSLPPSLLSTIHLALVILPIIQKGAIFIFSCFGAAMILACLLFECCSWVEKRNKIDKDKAKRWCQKPVMASYQKAKQYVPVGVIQVMKDVKGNGLEGKLWIENENADAEQNEAEHQSSLPLLKKVLPTLRKNCL